MTDEREEENKRERYVNKLVNFVEIASTAEVKARCIPFRHSNLPM
jgi:hypothetical protein